ncbi:TPA: hypothetical protein QDZ75_001219 [Stenotrophomonas maltophilia]|nr:hypothetical protein [Stenotrophomonas maltophilia]HEL5400941.1 hypothetical protein [Stenotrophomonas maltophilia]
MKATAQPKFLKAVQTVTEPPPNAKAPRHTVHWSDQVWRAKKLEDGISSRLGSLDRVLQAVTGLHRILLNDERNSEWWDGVRESGPGGLIGSDVEDLHNSIELLLMQAENTMFELREGPGVWSVKEGAR